MGHFAADLHTENVLVEKIVSITTVSDGRGRNFMRSIFIQDWSLKKK